MTHLKFLIAAIFLFTSPISSFAKQTICLNMIVKNESRVISRCLSSVKPLIDYWVISDTGSTDGTQEIIRDLLKDIPGELREDAWEDFATNRNIALDAAKDKANYILFIDADETFVYPEGFSLPPLDKDYYSIAVQNELGGAISSEYKRVLLIDSRLDWRWEGVLHESIDCQNAKTSDVLKDIVNISRSEEGFRSQDPQKYLHDAQVLEKALEKEPNNTRYVYYTAQSYLNTKERHKALEYFQRRVVMDPDCKNCAEIFFSLYQIGLLQRELNMDAEAIINSFTKAHYYCPWRAEPLYFLASFFLEQDNYLLAEPLLRRAAALKFPPDLHLVLNWVYDWGIQLKLAECLFKMQRFEESKSVIQKLIDVPSLPKEIRSSLIENMKIIDLYRIG